MLRAQAAEFANDVELSELETLAQDGAKRKAEADRLITQSQELFAQQKSSDAIQLLREAYALDKKNSLARAILSNALVEHARSLVETNWLEAETLTNQALSLNPAHPTAKTILSLIVEQKTTSPVEDWVSQAGKLQSSGDLFAALAWVAEGLAVHPHDPSLLQIQYAIQRDQDARRRQTRRRDMEDLRRMEAEIGNAVQLTAKTALAERIQGVAARYWTDGEILSIANSLLLRLGLVPKGGSTSSLQSKGAAVIFHVPRPNPPPSRADISPSPPISAAPSPVQLEEVRPEYVRPVSVPPDPALPSPASPGVASTGIVPQKEIPAAAPEAQLSPTPATALAVAESSEAEVTSSSQPAHAVRSNLATLMLVSAAAAIVAVAGTLFFARRHYAPPAAQAATAASPISAASVAASAVTGSNSTTAQPSPAAVSTSSDTDGGKVAPVQIVDQTAEYAQRRNFSQGKTPTATPTDVTSNFQPQPQPQPASQPRPASLTIQGGVPGTSVLVDQTLAGTIPADGTLSLSAINPGDHTVELRKERFKPREFKKHFVAGEAISLAAADAALEAVPGELKINFTPADAKLAIVKGDRLTMVSSGVPLNLDAGTYTLTARTSDGFRSSSTLELVAGQSRTLDLSLSPGGMSSWDDPAAWKHEKDSFIRKGGNFVLYGVVPAAGTFAFSAMPARGRLLQWVFNYTDPKNYVLFQMDDTDFYRTVIRNGEKTDEIKVAEKSDKKSLRELRIRVSPTELVHQIRHGDRWLILDRWTQPGADLSLGKFGFYIPGDDQVALSNFTHYAELNIR